MRRPARWQSIAVAVLGLLACAAGRGIDAARAQAMGPAEDNGLVYEKRFDLAPLGEPEPRTRVVHGAASGPGAWPAVVSLDVLEMGGRSGALCAGTVIAPRWVLTAAHCVFKRRLGGVKGVRAITAFAGSNRARTSAALRVERVIVHRGFAAIPRPGKGAGLINDIALLELETATDAPPQKLAAHAGRVLAAGTMMTIVGWGDTRPRGAKERHDTARRSDVLLAARVPVAERSACDAFLGFAGTPAGPVFCAGDGKGGADACNGDSGGPIFVAGRDGEPIQAGVVSWGDGCAVPGTYGVYAAIPDLEAWIRRRVPAAQWATPMGGAPGAIAGVGLPPAVPVRLQIRGLAEAQRQGIAAALGNAIPVGEGEAASLIWDARRQLVLDGLGQRIAEAVDGGRLRHAVDRQQALERLGKMAGRGSLEIGLDVRGRAPGAAGDAHRPDTEFAVRIAGLARGAYYTVFNLTGNGMLQLLVPSPYLRLADYPHEPSFAGPAFSSGARSSAELLEVRGGWVPGDGPFGAEHLVVVAGARPLHRLMPLLVRAHGRFDVAGVMAALAEEALAQPLEINLRGLYTAGK